MTATYLSIVTSLTEQHLLLDDSTYSTGNRFSLFPFSSGTWEDNLTYFTFELLSCLLWVCCWYESRFCCPLVKVEPYDADVLWTLLRSCRSLVDLFWRGVASEPDPVARDCRAAPAQVLPRAGRVRVRPQLQQPKRSPAWRDHPHCRKDFRHWYLVIIQYLIITIPTMLCHDIHA